MSIDPWLLQILVAVVFGLSGVPKLALPYQRLAGLFGDAAVNVALMALAAVVAWAAL